MTVPHVKNLLRYHHEVMRPEIPDNLLTPMSSKMFKYFFLQSKRNVGFWWKYSRICIHKFSLNGLQTVQGQNYSFSAASKGYKQYQTMHKGLI